jgi:hypothetical protein
MPLTLTEYLDLNLALDFTTSNGISLIDVTEATKNNG